MCLPTTRVQNMNQQNAQEVQAMGPVAKRSCRDVLFLILFAAYWVALLYIAAMAFRNGNPLVLISGKDMLGQVCGYNNHLTNSSMMDLTSKPYLYFGDLENLSAFQICVSSCPDKTSTLDINNYICFYNYTPKNLADLTSLVNEGLCLPYVYNSTAVGGRCIPTANVSQVLNSINIPDASTIVNTASSDYLQAVASLAQSWPIFAVAAVGSIVASFLMILILKYFVGFFVWLVIFLLQFVLIFFTIYILLDWNYQQHGGAHIDIPQMDLTSTMHGYQNYELALGILFAVLSLLFLLILCVMRKRLHIAVAILKTASEAIFALPLIVFYPIITVLAFCALIVYGLSVWVYLASIQSSDSFRIQLGSGNVGYNFSAEQFQYVHLFGMLWSLAFIKSANDMVIAGAIATYYWVRDKKQMPRCTICRSFYRTIRYHLGSIALGSLLVAIVQFIRILFYQFAQKLKKTCGGSKVFCFVVACVECCLCCLERLVKFINRNAFIYIAIHGKAFCPSAIDASGLLIRNVLRLIAVDNVSIFILFSSRLVITAAVTGCAYVVIRTYDLGLSNVGLPLTVVALEALILSGCFLSVYRMAIDTIFLCFCEDSEKNDGSPQKPYYMSDRLKQTLGVKNVKVSPMNETAPVMKSTPVND